MTDDERKEYRRVFMLLKEGAYKKGHDNWQQKLNEDKEYQKAKNDKI